MAGAGKRRKPRRLDADEQRLWARIAATTDALPRASAGGSDALPEPPHSLAINGKQAKLVMPEPRAGLHAAPRQPPRPRQAARANANGSLSSPRTPFTQIMHAKPDAGPVNWREPGLDRRTAARLRKGLREPDARIDLHGLTAEHAHLACLRFVANGAARQDRVLLVITGKGRRDQHGYLTNRGVLRESLPGWLRASPLGASILGIYQAHQKHGGAGAFYVYLKRPRPASR